MTVTDDWQPVIADVASPFRRRLLDGLAASIGERGYRDTTVADIVRHARTSKRTFYGEFSSKEECFIELLRCRQPGDDRPHPRCGRPGGGLAGSDPPGGRGLG